MAQSLNLKVAGLYTNPNQFSEVPEGALIVADNIQIDKGGVAEPRRGQKRTGTQLTLSGLQKINCFHTYQNKLLVSYANKLAYDSDGSQTWADYSGTYEANSGYRIKSTQANKNFYFTTDAGIKKLSSLTNTPADAGIPKALDGEGSTTGGSGFLPTASSVAYRLVWGLKDENDNLLLGSPSGRLVVTNSAGADRNVSLTWLIPDGITTSYFYQVYRSATVASSIEPNDELQLVYESNPTSGEISAGSFTFTDIVSSDLRGATLYTSPSQEGILQANEQPPVANDICTFKGMTFYANTKTKQRLFLTIFAIGGTAGLNVNDTVTINGVVYTGKAAENSALGEFLVYISGTAAENIERTAISLVRVVNKYASNTALSAYYMSGYNDLPGRILFEANTVATSIFYAVSSRGSAFNPTLPTSGTAVGSSNDESPNRVFFSKIQQPEAVPLLNYLNAGSANDPIKRIIPLRDSVFILKSEGIYRIIGEDPTSLRISLFDNTIALNATESAVELENQVYCYTDQGVVAISDNGVKVMGRPIEDQLQRAELLSNFQTDAFGVAYEQDRKYLFFCKSGDGDDAPTQGFVYNYFTNAWTRFELERTAGIEFNNRLYMGSLDGYVNEERKTLTTGDYMDNEYAVTIVSSSGTTVTLASASSVAIGMTLDQGANESYITAVNGNDITVEDTISWTAGSATVYESIESVLEWSQESAGNPGILKHFREITAIFRTADFKAIETGFSTNFDSLPEYTTLTPIKEGGWGTFPWGSLPWGSGRGRNYPIRTYIPLKKRRASWIFLRIRSRKYRNNFAIQGISVVFEPMTEKFK